jgi:hypothetical protein
VYADARTVKGHHLAQKVEKRTAVEILLVLHQSPHEEWPAGVRRQV